VRSVLVVVVEERAHAFTARSAAVGGTQVDVVVFECAPQSLDEDVIKGPSCPVH
jgi:hypothetical protein